DSRCHQSCHQCRRASGAGGRAHYAPGACYRARERDRRHRLRLCAGAFLSPRASVGDVGEVGSAGRRSPACEQGALVLGFRWIGTSWRRVVNVNAQAAKGLAIPFDHHRLDRLMDEAGIDVVLATSKHNVQYLLGGHRADFFDYMDATGVTRYLPVLVYPKGAPEKAAYIGHRLEKFQREVNPMWTPETQTNTAGSVDAMQKAVDYIRKAGLKTKRVAVEFGFLPYDASNVLREAFPDADWGDALFVLERQRVRKSPEELKLLKFASEAVIESMQAVIAAAKPG